MHHADVEREECTVGAPALMRAGEERGHEARDVCVVDHGGDEGGAREVFCSGFEGEEECEEGLGSVSVLASHAWVMDKMCAYFMCRMLSILAKCGDSWYGRKRDMTSSTLNSLTLYQL